jgi:hypothetical protein
MHLKAMEGVNLTPKTPSRPSVEIGRDSASRRRAERQAVDGKTEIHVEVEVGPHTADKAIVTYRGQASPLTVASRSYGRLRTEITKPKSW